MSPAPADDLAALLAMVSGGAVDPDRLADDVRAQRDVLAELAELWSVDLTGVPAAGAFSPAWEEDGEPG